MTETGVPSHVSARDLGRLLDSLRRKRPLVQCVTNLVSMDVTANVLLALGASPAMVHAPEESGEFIGLADSLVCNIGTLSQAWLDSLETAAAAAAAKGRPWALDPVGVGATQFRNAAVERLLVHRPTAIRGNASEIIAMARNAGLTEQVASSKGVDGFDSGDDALTLSRRLAQRHRCVVAATGAVDIVTDGSRVAKLSNGSPLMARVTALGCALSAVVAAFLAVTDDSFEAVVAALAVYGVAGDMAAAGALRPGSFRVAFIDALDAIGAQDLMRAKID